MRKNENCCRKRAPHIVSMSLIGMALLSLFAAGVASAEDFRFVVLSDVHVGRRNFSYQEKYAELIHEITTMQPQPAAVFVTGDLVDHGLESEYDRYREWIMQPLKAAGIPHYALPGNHEIGGDTNHNTLAMWTKKMGPLYQAVNLHGGRFILTCGLPENVTGGYAVKSDPTMSYGIGQGGEIDTNQLAWIKRELESEETQKADFVLLLNHFPLWPVDFGGYEIKEVDYWGRPTAAGSTLRQWMDTYKVDAWLCGHRHFQALPVAHKLASGWTAWNVLSESAAMGKSAVLPDPTHPRGKRTCGGWGYEVYDVVGTELRHFRKTLAKSGFDLIGPTNSFVIPLLRLRRVSTVATP